MSRVTNYYDLGQGQTFDILYLDYQDGFPNGKLLFQFSKMPRKITGLQKVVQTFLYYLLTHKGTDLLYPNKGTYFTEYTWYTNSTGNQTELQQLIEPEIKSAESQSKSSLNFVTNDPLSQLSKVDILFIEAVEDRMSLYLKLTTNSGDTASVSVPFPQTNLKLNG